MTDFFCPRCEKQATPVTDNGRQVVYTITSAKEGNVPAWEVPFSIFNCPKCGTRFGVECSDIPKDIPND